MPTTTAALRSAHCEACFIVFISGRDRPARRPSRTAAALLGAPSTGAPVRMTQQPSTLLESPRGGGVLPPRPLWYRVAAVVPLYSNAESFQRRIQGKKPWESLRCGTLQGTASYQTTTRISKARRTRSDTPRVPQRVQPARPGLGQCALRLPCALRCERWRRNSVGQIKLSRADGMRTARIG